MNETFDSKWYRPNVGIVVCNKKGQVLWARRINHTGWQFPQGGIDKNETSKDAAFREMEEELGLKPTHVRLIGATKNWLRYDIPDRFRRNIFLSSIRGQKQRWFLFELLGEESDVCLDCTDHPEFDAWKWIDYWKPPELIIEFKRAVYQEALTELEPLIQQIRELSEPSSSSTNH